MYRHDDAAQPRDRRAWTEDEDELLRQAIEKGTLPITSGVPTAH